MVLAIHQFTVTDEAGNALPNAMVEVQREAVSAPIASLFSDRAGAMPLGNPFNADADGFAAFHVAGGAYRITATSGSFTHTRRYVAIGLAAEADDQPAGVGFFFDGGVSDQDPGAGAFAFNNATPGLATKLFISQSTPDGLDVGAWLADWSAGGITADRGTLTIQGGNGAAVWLATVSGDVTDDGAYYDVPVTVIAATAAGSFAEGVRYGVGFVTRGTDGSIAGPSSAVAGQIAVFSDASGDIIEGGESEDSPHAPVLLADILDASALPDAAEAQRGVVEMATDGEVRSAATGAKALMAQDLESAAAGVALTDAATVAVDWDTGINFTLTVTASRAIGNPTNGQPGTFRTIMVQGNDGTDRTITFGNQFLGEVPTITDCDSGRWYLLSIYCHSASHFVVSAKRANG